MDVVYLIGCLVLANYAAFSRHKTSLPYLKKKPDYKKLYNKK